MKNKSFEEKDHSNKKRKSHNQKIHDAHRQRAQEKQAAKEAKETHQQAVNTAMAQYKSDKQTRSKKIAKKTRRGQPVMQGQIDLLLEKIQKQKEKQ